MAAVLGGVRARLEGWIGQESRVDVVPDRERWMTVDVAPRQPGLPDGTGRLRGVPGGREDGLVGVAPGMSSAVPPGRCPPSRRRLRCHPLLPAGISQTLGGN